MIDFAGKSDTKLDEATIDQSSPEGKKWWQKGLPAKLWKSFTNDFANWVLALTGVAILTLFAWYYGLDKQLAVQAGVSNAKIEFLEKKFSESEIAYKERVERELKLAKCRNGVILECYNKCNLQEVLKRQNVCEATK